MGDIRFPYTSALNLWGQLITFLVSEGWTVRMRRLTTDPLLPGICILEGGKESKWTAPPVIGIHYLPTAPNGTIAFQAFKQRAYLPTGLSDFFDDGNLSFRWILHLEGTNVEDPEETAAQTLQLKPGIGSWAVGVDTYTYVYQGVPGEPYAFEARIVAYDGFVNDGAVGVAIRNNVNDHFVRFYAERSGGVYSLVADYSDGVGVFVIKSALIVLSPPTDLYIEQLGGLLLFYYRQNNGAWQLFDFISLDERVYFDGDEEAGMFAYSTVDTWEPQFGYFTWQRYFYGAGNPLYFANIFEIDPAAPGQCVVASDQSKFTLLTDPVAGTEEIVHAGAFQDHTDSRFFDSKVCLIKPLENKLGLYVSDMDVPKAREGLNPEQATAALGRPYVRTTALSWALEDQPQTRDGSFILHPLFVGVQFSDKQSAGETENLYITGSGIGAPSDYDLLEFQSEHYLYFGGVVFGPVTPIGGETIYDAMLVTWVDPGLRWTINQLLPATFSVYEGAEQPQIVVEWGEPPAGWDAIDSLRVVRKQQEYPRDVDDGLTVYTGDGLDGGISDRVLLPDLFYYYKLFILRDGYGWVSDDSVQGNALSWQSGWGESKIYNNLPSVFRVYDAIQKFIMELSQRSPEILNFQENELAKGFLNRMIKNYGLEVDRIRAFLKAFELSWNPLEGKLDWLTHMGGRYFFAPFQGDPGIRQRFDFLAWPHWLRKKGTELLYTSIIEQSLGVTPNILIGSERTLWASVYPQSHTFNFGPTFNPGVDQGNFDKIGHEDDPNVYTHGYRTAYNIKGIFVYVTGTFTPDQLVEVKAKLRQFTPISSVILFHVNNNLVFTLKVEEEDGTVYW